MKTSNKILVSFLLFAWLSFMATLLISHQFADYHNIPGMRKVSHKISTLEKFSVVIIDKASEIRIIPGDSALLRYDEIAGEGFKPLESSPVQNFELRNDTLFVKNLNLENVEEVTLEVVGLKHLVVSNAAEIELIGFSQDSLTITSENSNVTISESSEFSFLHLKSAPKFDLVLKAMKEFSLSLTNDNCNVFGEIGEISGTVGNYARLGMPRETEQVDVDTSINGKLDFVFK